jgi:hypothetical protein
LGGQNSNWNYLWIVVRLTGSGLVANVGSTGSKLHATNHPHDVHANVDTFYA